MPAKEADTTGCVEDARHGAPKRPLSAQRVANSFQFRASRLVVDVLHTIMPATMLATVKSMITATIPLDYERAQIRIYADSPIDFVRAKPRRKEPGTVRWIERSVGPGDVFYDVGANVGAYAMIAAAQADGAVISHAFEPSFSTYGQLCKNVILNGYAKNVFPHLIVLGEQTAMSVFNYQSLSAGSSLHTAGATVDYRGSTFAPVYQQRVLAFSLDDLVFTWGLEMPTHIKVDVDGTELQVLAGARRVTSDPRLRSILVEVCHDRGDGGAILELMSAAGFWLESDSPLAQGVSNWIFERGPS